MKSKNIEEINKFVVDNIILAANTCIPKKIVNKAKRLKIPKYLSKLIIHRRYLNKNKKKIDNNGELNFMNRIIRLELKQIKNKKWSNFADNINNNPLASKKCWKRINDIKKHGIKKDENYPKMR